MKSILRRFSATRPERIEGEVLARGPNVFAGYLNLPTKNKEAFTEVDGDRWFRTGDLGWIDGDGFLHLTGRVSTMIVTEGGKHVQPDDVEEVYQSHPAVREIGILQKDDPQRLVALVVPAQRQMSEARSQRSEVRGQKANADKRNGVDGIIRHALDEQGRRLRPYERIAEYVITYDPLPKTRLGKIQHHLLEELYEKARSGKAGAKEKAGPIPEAQMSGEDQELLRDPATGAIWEWLAERFPDVRLTPDSSLQTDLQIDSMEWLNLTLEIGQRAGVELDEDAIGRVETVRDLLQEVSTASAGGAGNRARLEEALREPEKYLDDEQRRWLEPLSSGQAALARLLYSVNRAMMRLFFRVKVLGFERLPRPHAPHSSGMKGNFVIAPNHVSYLDSFAIAAALDYAHLKRTCWAGWTGTAFRGPVTRWLSRLARVVPVDPDRAVLSSLALAVAVLKRGDNLVWFPEGARSPDGQLQPLRPGIGIVLEHQPAAVIPTLIEGAHEAMPPGRFLPKPHRIRVTFGEAVMSDALDRKGEGDEPHERITTGLQGCIERLVKQSPG